MVEISIGIMAIVLVLSIVPVLKYAENSTKILFLLFIAVKLYADLTPLYSPFLDTLEVIGNFIGLAAMISLFWLGRKNEIPMAFIVLLIALYALYMVSPSVLFNSRTFVWTFRWFGETEERSSFLIKTVIILNHLVLVCCCGLMDGLLFWGRSHADSPENPV